MIGTAAANNGMHPTRNGVALNIKGSSGRVMVGVGLLRVDEGARTITACLVAQERRANKLRTH